MGCMELHSRRNQAADPWVGDFRPKPDARLRLFCFPYAGGTSSIYRGWPALFPEIIDVCPVNLPGRAARLYEPAFKSIVLLADELGRALVPYCNIPFAFFGHSMGANVSFELARALRRTNNETPIHLFVSGHRAPHIPDEDPPTYNLPEDEFIEELRRLDGTPTEILEHPELMQLMLPLLRADFEAVQTYAFAAEAPLSCPITAFGGLSDFDVPRENVDAWREHTTRKFTIRMLPGDHFFINTESRMLIECISRELCPVANLTARQ
jgi:medium-chain acyl-[acyl-carrier-protein] hydrolase